MTQDKCGKRDKLEYARSRAWYASVSFWALVISNVVVILWAVRDKWPLSLIVWVYLCQNFILGIFWPAKVFASSVDSSYTDKVKSVFAFIPHYMVTNFVYSMFLFNFFRAEFFANFMYIFAMAGIFFLSETVSYFAQTTRNRSIPLSLAKVQLFPYARVLPMHFIIVFGIILEATGEYAHLNVLIFLSLKAVADIAMHIVEQSRVFGNVVTYLVERHTHLIEKQRQTEQFPWKPEWLKDEPKVCRFCQRKFAPNETPRTIKSNLICDTCFKKIETARKDSNSTT